MACGSFTCSKNALAALNVLYILVAFILIGVASYGKAVALIGSISILGGIIACGVLLLIVAIVGLIGAIRHHQVLLFFYMIILFLIFLIQFSVACACLAVDTQKQRQLAEKSWRSSSNDSKHLVQRFFHCCGFYIDNQDRWDDEALGHPPCKDDVPECLNSDALCCLGSNPGGNNTSNSSSSVVDDNTTENNTSCGVQACYIVIQEHMNQAVKTTGGIGLFFSFTEIFGVWITVKFRNTKDPKANPSAFL